MVYRLKSRTQCPPNGFLYEQRQTGWRNHLIDPSSQWDFGLTCRLLQEHRKANPRFKLQTNMKLIEEEVDLANAARVAAIPGAELYLIPISDASAINPPSALSSLPQKLMLAVAGLKKASAGGAILLDWEQSGDPPVFAELSEARATVCADCPKNGKGDFTRWFTVPASELIRKQIERVTQINLSTSKDAELGVCEACLCPLKLKVHTPLTHIVKRLSEPEKAELDPRCWILSESK